MRLTLTKRVHTSLKTMCLSVTVSFIIWFYFTILETTEIFPLPIKWKTKKEQSVYPCVTLCSLDLFADLFEGPLKQDVENLTLSNYLLLWWDGLVCKEKLFNINYTEVNDIAKKNSVEKCIPSTFIYKKCKNINTEAPWDYLEPLCYTIHLQEYGDIYRFFKNIA